MSTTFLRCSNYSAEIRENLKLAEENRTELEKVLEHYRNGDDEEKWKAALFLIGNMEDKKTLFNRSNAPFENILALVDSIQQEGNSAFISNERTINTLWDSIANRYGQPIVRKEDEDSDLVHIRAAYLIDHIDHVFKVWRENPRSKGISFEEFCEYILPYRIGNETLEPWAHRLYEKWAAIIRDEKLDSVWHIARFVNDRNAKQMSHMRLLWKYPYDFTSTRFERIRKGSCRHGVLYTAQTLRALGIPTAIDFSRKWAGANNGHEWNVIFLEDGSMHPFDAIDRGLKIDLSWRKIAKIYRRTYARQKHDIDITHQHEIPSELMDSYVRDVTEQYTKTFDIHIPVIIGTDHRYAVISTYSGFDWVPQAWGEIKKGKALFRNMGSNNLYTVALYHAGQYMDRTDPFLLDSLGNIQFFEPDRQATQDMILKRKFPLTPYMEGIMAMVLQTRIQGSNRRDFKDSTTFFAITDIPRKFETVNVHDNNTYRYVRIWLPRAVRGDMAELEFYGLANGDRDTVRLTGTVIGDPKADIKEGDRHYFPFDGDLLTYFTRPRGISPWVGLDLGRPRRIVKVRYCPRSDTNFIEVGDTYELFMYDMGIWQSQGVQVATDQHLLFRDMPIGGLFILVNKSKGVENKIFSYRDDKQIWL